MVDHRTERGQETVLFDFGTVQITVNMGVHVECVRKKLKTHRLRTEATLRLNGPQWMVKMREIFQPNYHKLLGIVYLIVDSHHSNLLIDNMYYLACL